MAHKSSFIVLINSQIDFTEQMESFNKWNDHILFDMDYISLTFVNDLSITFELV